MNTYDTIVEPYLSSPNGSERQLLDVTQSAHAQLIHEAQAAVTALHRMAAQDQTSALGSSPGNRTTDPSNGLASASGHRDDGGTVAADRTERSSTLVSVEYLLISDTSPVVRQAVSTHAPVPAPIPGESSDAATAQPHAPSQTLSLGCHAARRPGQPHTQGVHGGVHSSLQDHATSDAPRGQPDSMHGPLGSERRADPPNIKISAPLDEPAETQMAFCRPSPRRPPPSGLASSLEHAATTYPVMHGFQGRAQLISHNLRQLGQLLLARRGVAGIWSVDVDVLMRQDAPRFFDYCCWFMGLPGVSRLGVKLPDVSP